MKSLMICISLLLSLNVLQASEVVIPENEVGGDTVPSEGNFLPVDEKITSDSSFNIGTNNQNNFNQNERPTTGIQNPKQRATAGHYQADVVSGEITTDNGIAIGSDRFNNLDAQTQEEYENNQNTDNQGLEWEYKENDRDYNITTDETGQNVDNPAQIDWTNPAELKEYSLKMAKEVGAKGKEYTSNPTNDRYQLTNQVTEHLKSEYIKSKTAADEADLEEGEEAPLSAVRDSIITVENLHDDILNRIARNRSFKCLIQRKLNHSYFCPIKNSDEYWIGGTIESGNGELTSDTRLQEEQKELCDGICQEEVSCVSSPVPNQVDRKDISVIENTMSSIGWTQDLNGMAFPELDESGSGVESISETSEPIDLKNGAYAKVELDTALLTKMYQVDVAFSVGEESSSIEENQEEESDSEETEELSLTEKFLRKYDLYFSFDQKNTYLNVDTTNLETEEDEYETILVAKDRRTKVRDVLNRVTLIEGNIVHASEFVFYKPYIQPKERGESRILLADFEPDEEDIEWGITKENIKLTISKISAEYADTQYWFCPQTQFVTAKSQCEGSVYPIQLGEKDPDTEIITWGSYRYVCKDGKTGDKREKKYNAYFLEESCNSECKVQAECMPTYRHLNQLNNGSGIDITDGLPRQFYDIQVSCAEGDDNIGCIEEECKSAVANDVFPIEEKVYTSNGEFYYTVEAGVQKATVRPKVDYGGWTSVDNQTSSDAEYQAILLNEKKDASYISMITDKTYNISQEAIANGSDTKIGYALESFDDEVDLWYKLKPHSFDYGTGQMHYVYFILGMDVSYHPAGGAFNVVDSSGKPFLLYGSSNPGIVVHDKIYLIKDGISGNNFKAFYRQQYYKGLFPFLVKETITDENGNTSESAKLSFQYSLISNENLEEYSTYDSSLYQYVAYDENSEAPTTEETTFPKEVLFIENKAVENIFDWSESNVGIGFKSQNVTNNGMKIQKLFDGEINFLRKSSLADFEGHVLYSDTKLSYKEIYEKIKDGSHMLYRHSSPREFSETIEDDGAFNNDKVEIFLQGAPTNLSVYSKMKPNHLEEDNNAFIFMFLKD